MLCAPAPDPRPAPARATTHQRGSARAGGDCLRKRRPRRRADRPPARGGARAKPRPAQPGSGRGRGNGERASRASEGGKEAKPRPLPTAERPNRERGGSKGKAQRPTEPASADPTRRPPQRAQRGEPRGIPRPEQRRRRRQDPRAVVRGAKSASRHARMGGARRYNISPADRRCRARDRQTPPPEGGLRPSGGSVGGCQVPLLGSAVASVHCEGGVCCYGVHC